MKIKEASEELLNTLKETNRILVKLNWVVISVNIVNIITVLVLVYFFVL